LTAAVEVSSTSATSLGAGPGCRGLRVSPEPPTDGLLDRPRDRPGIGVVRLDGQDALAVGVDLLGDGFGLVGGVGAGERHRGSIPCQPLGDRRSDPAAAAPHQRYLARKLLHVCLISVFVTIYRGPVGWSSALLTPWFTRATCL
jgi:hypothetical protein